MTDRPAHERIRAVAQNLRDSTLGDALEIASDDAADTLDAIADEVERIEAKLDQETRIYKSLVEEREQLQARVAELENSLRWALAVVDTLGAARTAYYEAEYAEARAALADTAQPQESGNE